MALDKNFLKYKLEKIKNDDIFKDQDSDTKKSIRKANSKKAAKEAEAIHSYLTGIDSIKPFMNKSFIDPDSMPGNLAINELTGQLNVTQAKTASAPTLPMIPGFLPPAIAGRVSNAQKSKALKILKRLFDSLNIVFKPKKLLMDKDFETKGQVNVGKNIIIGGSGTINQNLIISGDHTIGGRLTVSRMAQFHGGINLRPMGARTPSDLMVDGNIQGTKDLTLGQNLKIEKDGEIGGNLNVERDENIKGNLNVGNDEVVGGNLSVENNVDISGNSNIGGGLNVTKISNTMGIHNVGLALNVMGPAIFGGGLIIAPFPIPPIPGMIPPRRNKNSANLTVTGNINGHKKLTLGGELNVGGDGIIEGNVRVARSVDVQGDINLRGNENVNGDINLSGNGNVNGDLSVEGILNVGESSATENGYTYLPNGIILQWGTGTSTSDDEESFEFPIAFPNACFNVVTQRTNGDAQDILPVQNITATNFEINRNSVIDGSEGFYYQAIGN